MKILNFDINQILIYKITMFSTIRKTSNLINKTQEFTTLTYTDEESLKYIYQGKLNDIDEFNGYGKLWNELFSFHGNFQNNNLEGYGILTYTNKLDKLDDTFPISYKGTFSNNKKNGEGIETYANKDFYKGTFLNDFRHGAGILYNYNGEPKIESNWELGRSINTTYITDYYNNGNIEYKGNFNGITRDGSGTLFDITGTILFDGIFENGKFKKGKLYSNNFISFEGEFNEKNKPLNGTFYHNNGIVFCKGIVKDVGGINYIIGKTKVFTSTGRMIFDGNTIPIKIDLIPKIDPIKTNNIEYNVLMGDGIIYFNSTESNWENTKSIPSHLIRTNENYQLHGEIIIYQKNGEMIISPYNNGILNGIQKKYINNELSSQITWLNGKYNGEFINFLDSNRYTDKIIYENNKITKLYIRYKDDSNKLKYEGDGIIINGIIKYHGQGKTYYNNEQNTINFDGIFNESVPQGEGISYYENGYKMYEGEFNKGKKHNIGSSYYESTGTIEYTGGWVNDEKQGEGMLLDETGSIVYQGLFQYGDMN
mgnify:FL=1|jgi:antitoxin component YwqK of YwqJK toxin-antitoxin module